MVLLNGDITKMNKHNHSDNCRDNQSNRNQNRSHDNNTSTNSSSPRPFSFEMLLLAIIASIILFPSLWRDVRFNGYYLYDYDLTQPFIDRR